MKRINRIGTLVILMLLFSNFYNIYATSNADFIAGIYSTSGNEHKIEIKSDNTVLYDDKYSLNINTSEKGSYLSGKIGTDETSITFFKINDVTLLSTITTSYKHNDQTIYLYDYTAFRMNSLLSNIDPNGAFELYRGEEKINTFVDLQSAIDAANTGDIIKLNKDFAINQGAHISGKNITIDGLNNSLDRTNWTNAVFVVDEDATLNLKNITIDGGAKGFEIDYDAVNYNNGDIPFIKGSTANDPQQKLSAIISKGNLVADNIAIKNNYTISDGAAINVISGNITLKNSTLEHNRTKFGGAIYAGTTLKQGQTTNPVSKIIINNTLFTRNYAAAGGAITFFNVKEVKIGKTNFISNTVDQNGGAIYVKRGYKPVMENYDMDYTQIKVTDSLFENNFSGNDGIAIENEEAEFTITNTIFRNNVGANLNGSRATFCNPTERGSNWSYQYLKGCLFEGNKGEISCIWDNGTKTTIIVEDTNFFGNIGKKSILYSTAVTSYTNCLFSGEKVDEAVITFAPNDTSGWYEGSGYTEPNILVKDTQFINFTKDTDVAIATEGGANDALVKANVVFDGDTKANVYLKDGNFVTLKGNFSGNVVVDYKTDLENVIVDESVNIDGKIIDRNLYVEYENGNGEKFKEQILIDTGKKVSPWYMQCFLDVWKEGYALYFYTDKKYQNKWDYIVVDGSDLFARWEEHTHSFVGTLNEKTGVISELCDCGCPFERLKLVIPENFEYDGKEKNFTVEYVLGETYDDYILKYFEKVNDDWQETENIPKNSGRYKVELSYEANLMNIDNIINLEYEYEITKAIPKITVGNLSQRNTSIKQVTYMILPEVTDGVATIEYKLSSAEDLEYTEELPKEVGKYLVRIKITNDTNLEDTEIIKTLTITKKSSGLSKPKYEIKVIENIGGYVSPNTTSVTKDTDKTFKITVNEGYEIEDVLVDDKSIGVVTEYTFEKVNKNHTIEVKFKEIEKTEEEEWNNPFKDVTENDWFYNSVKFVNQNGLMNGVALNEFEPNKATTRAMLVTILYRYSKENVVKNSTFDDVQENTWYTNAIAWAEGNEIVKGIGDNKFDPNGEITREQLVTILYRYAKYVGKDISVGENTNILSYDDFENLDEYAIPAMQWACGEGIIEGRTISTINPNNTATRAEIATIMMRFINKE